MVFRVVQELSRASRLVLRLRRCALLRADSGAPHRADVVGCGGRSVGATDPWQSARPATICRTYIALLRSDCEAADHENAAGPWLVVCRSSPHGCTEGAAERAARERTARACGAVARRRRRRRALPRAAD